MKEDDRYHCTYMGKITTNLSADNMTKKVQNSDDEECTRVFE